MLSIYAKAILTATRMDGLERAETLKASERPTPRERERAGAVEKHTALKPKKR